MLFHVRMDVHLPADLDPQERAKLVGREKAYSIWRIVGEYANFSVFDVESNEELHQILSALPLFPHMHIHVTPLATHPSDINA